MLNRLVSNLVLGFFVVVLVVVYSVAKQVPAYQMTNALGSPLAADTSAGDKTSQDAGVQVAGDSTALVSVTTPTGKMISARVADNADSRNLGLSGTDSLADGQGMLFVFDAPDNYGIWMKDMKYDIDIVWLDADGNVVKVVADAKMPPAGTIDDNLTVYKNTSPAKYVLELPSGAAAVDGLAVGAKANIS